ncbi:hypothetical protein HY29_17810 [Hyphomonas beringensis]|uniref:Oxidoreductase n=1 Tax=Hyphomonas beringensis TaxID=1280946 RepID=A0A062U5A5_9PROT|nr:Gfo/Idh/MocA family oxidoreductase [Hyphomonas beringensis]KCZ52938.1 hypothetical protein HY29_17810 [Hyphomonas beringensis]
MKFAIVGPGFMGQEHARRISLISGVELAGFVHPNGQRTSPAGLESVPWEPSIESLLRQTPIDGVIISTPNRCHAEYIVECARRGLPVLVEKPMTENLADAISSLKAIESAGIPALVGHHRLYNPIIECAQRLLSSERLGQLVNVRGSAKYLKPPAYFVDGPWRSEPGGGPLKINFVHDVASVMYLLGPIEAVQAIASSTIRRTPVEDTAAVILQFESGVLGSFMISDCSASAESWETTAGENSTFPHHPNEACYEISGTRASLKIPTLELIEPVAGAPCWTKPYERHRIAVLPADPLTRQLEHFASVISGEAKPRVTARFGAQVVAVISAIEESILSGARKRVQPCG